MKRRKNMRRNNKSRVSVPQGDVCAWSPLTVLVVNGGRDRMDDRNTTATFSMSAIPFAGLLDLVKKGLHVEAGP